MQPKNGSLRPSHVRDSQFIPSNIHLVALIATHNRPVMLRERALASVTAQKQKPDRIVIVDDSTPDRRHETEHVITAFQERHPDLPIVLLPNTRSRGAAGAWNTGLFWLDDHFQAQNPLIAILDDDDEWLPDHLALIEAATVANPASTVFASGHVRREGGDLPDRSILPPEQLRADDFLIGNPGVQGSNMSARLDAFVRLGGFDEHLPSCTDRDICLRWIDADARYQAIPQPTVLHHAEAGRKDRLSTPASRAKHHGLDGFWRKYRDRMTPDVKTKFLERAVRLFQWQPPDVRDRRAWLVVGITSDSAHPERVAPLLDGLLELTQQPAVIGLDVLLLENGPLSEPGRPSLRQLAEQMRAKGLRVTLISYERQVADAAAGAFGASFCRPDGRASIMHTRTMLQAYLYALMQRRPGSIGWILDDDLRLGERTSPVHSRQLVEGLLQLREDNVDVVLGSHTEAAPLPLLSMLPGELLHLQANLSFLLSLDPSSVLPDRSAENEALLRQHPDAYHAFSSQHTAHLQRAVWLTPNHPGETAGGALKRMCEQVPGLRNGRPVSRSLPADTALEFVSRAKDSIHRGGNTWILNADVLADTPNLAAVFDGDPCRRSDMVWAALLRDRFDRKIVQVPVALSHDRREEAVSDPWQDQVRDIRGHALTHALTTSIRDGKDFVNEATFRKAYGERLRERTSQLDRSLREMKSRVQTIRRLLNTPEHSNANWRAEELDNARQMNFLFLDWVEDLISGERAAAALIDLQEAGDRPVRDFIASLPDRLQQLKLALAKRDRLIAAAEADRRAIAEAGVRTIAKPADSLRFLGEGREGVVFTDGTQVYKWFDMLPLRVRPDHLEFLRGLVGKLKKARCLPRLRRVHEVDGHVVIGYDYLPSEPYHGGHGPGLVRLLLECREYGIAFNNLHPDNLRVHGEDVLLIDVGADIVPWSEENWRHMINRAWLSWRWWVRDDLKPLMTRALRDDSLPELDGVERLRGLLDAPDATEQLTKALVAKVDPTTPVSVLDYGCGKGGLVQALVAQGHKVTGWDPDGSLPDRWRRNQQESPGATYGGPELLERLIDEGRTFDVVFSTLVLCILRGDEHETALRNLRRLVKPGGRVIVTVCNPFQTFGGSTPFKSRPMMTDRDFDEVFPWTGCSGSTGCERHDVHRPPRVLERDLARHGLRVFTREQSRTADLERFEPASDFMTLEMVPDDTIKLPATLAIKACAMDHRTIEQSVKHLVEQFEGPEVFEERMVVVDSRTASFTREHDTADMDALHDGLERLQRQSYIDRVVFAPSDEEAVRALNRRWFGLDSPATHAANGSPITTALTLFEEVRTPYLLQLDADMMIHHAEPREAVVGQWIQLLEDDPEAVTFSVPIATREAWAPQAGDVRGLFRMEVRASLVQMDRFRQLRPYPNSESGSTLGHAWYRSFDRRIADGAARSLHIGDPRLWATHPPNTRKHPVDEWLMVREVSLRGPVPDQQYNQPEWSGAISDWLGPKRDERFVFILQGRNITPGRMQRAIDSVSRQSRDDWGAIIFDDASDALQRDWLNQKRRELDGRWTVLQSPVRRYGMANLVWAIRHVCVNRDSIIVLVDLDDCLLGSDVLDVVVREYEQGADMTIGSMLRTDKQKKYHVDLAQPRRPDNSNIWIHLRTFRKSLFDRVPDELLRDEDGSYFRVGQDWAFMLPMVEHAAKPVHIEHPLYLYEPFGDGKSPDEQPERRRIRRFIVTRPSLLIDLATEEIIDVPS